MAFVHTLFAHPQLAPWLCALRRFWFTLVGVGETSGHQSAGGGGSGCALILVDERASQDASSPGVLRDAQRVAVAAGLAPTVGSVGGCRRQWSEADAVLVHADIAAAVLEQSLPRRGGVCVVTDPVDATQGPDPAVWREALALGATDVYCLPDDEQRLVADLGLLRSPRGGRGRVVAVVPGHGGAGASVLAAAVAAQSAVSGRRTLLVDLDAEGPGLDLTLGLEQAPGLRWHELSIDAGAVDGPALHAALPQAGESLSLLTFGRSTREPVSTAAALSAVTGGRSDATVIVDVPCTAPSFGAIIDVADYVAVVTTATVPGCAAARLRVEKIRGRAPHVGAVVRGPAPAGLTPRQVAQAMDVPLAVSYRNDVRLPAQLDCGGLRYASRDARRLRHASRDLLSDWVTSKGGRR